MQRGDLSAAEAAFRQALSERPSDVPALVNLAVVYMREQKWPQALAELQSAEKLAPNIPGIRMNIALTYYRQGQYDKAIPPFESVVNADPGSTQARHLLGLCYLFEERYADAARTLEPLWDQSNYDLSYLYALSVAASRSGRPDLDLRATARLLEVGKDSPALHLLMGKAYLQHDTEVTPHGVSGPGDDQALQEFQKAAAGDPNLSMLHYHLGVVYRRKQDLPRAKQEFLKEAAIDPDEPYTYAQLGEVCTALDENGDARRYYQKAVQLDPKLTASWYGLAKLAKQQKDYPDALKYLQRAGVLDPKSPSIHYLRFQVLTALGKTQEAKAEEAAVHKLQQETNSKLEQELSGKYHDPQIATDK